MKDPIQEANRYLDNAKDILRTKAKKDGAMYSDKKYVRMACNTAYNGVLVALDAFAEKKGKHPKKRPDVYFYRDLLGKENRKILKLYNTIYDLLHLAGGYDGNLAVSVSSDGIKFSKELIMRIANRIK